MISRLLFVSIMVSMELLVVGFANGQAQPADTTSSGHALLVGVTRYPKLDGKDLQGPSSDVAIMSTLLQERFKFSPQNIVTLSEEAGGNDPSKLPERANIVREFESLAKKATKGEWVVAFLSGHGSNQPNNDPESDVEVDGEDEIFLPRDTGQWEGEGSAGTVNNAIVDDEIGRWLKEIVKKQALVWLVVDSCHSGTMLRGIDERVRYVRPADLGVPAIPARQAIPIPTGVNRSSANQEDTHLGLLDGVVAMYACQPNEVTIETRLPQSAPDAKMYGLLTYSICQELVSAQTSVSFEELARRVYGSYTSMHRSYPIPFVEGGLRKQEVLGKKKWDEPLPITLNTSVDPWQISAGALHGLTRNAVFAVHPRDGRGENAEPLGHVRVTELMPHLASVKPCRFESDECQILTNANLPNGAICEIAQIDYGELRLRVAIDPEDNHGQAIPAADLASVQSALQKYLQQADCLVRQVQSPADAEWILRVDAGKTYLLPAAEWSRARETSSVTVAPVQPSDNRLLGPAPADGQQEWVRDSLAKIAKAENLKRWAPITIDDPRATEESQKLQLELSILLDLKGDGQLTPVEWPKTGRPQIFDGDLFTVRIRNTGRVSADITLLYIDAEYGIVAPFPDNELNRLQPDDKINVKLQAAATVTGLEHIVVIAVRSSGQPVEFTGLAQKSIDRARTRGERSLDSPLGKLLQNSLFASSTARAVRIKERNEFKLQRFTWEMMKQPRPN